MDVEHTTPPRAAVSRLELEPTQRLGDDEGLGCRESADLAGRAAEEAPPSAGRAEQTPGPEGEFDALLLWQEVDDLVGVATLGNCDRGLSARALRSRLGCPRLLVAYDVDTEGDDGTEQLQQLSPRKQRIRPPVGKDVTAFWQAGGRVPDWAQFELARLCAVPGAG